MKTALCYLGYIVAKRDFTSKLSVKLFFVAVPTCYLKTQNSGDLLVLFSKSLVSKEICHSLSDLK